MVFNILHSVYTTTLLVNLAVTSTPILLVCVEYYQDWSTVAGVLVSTVGRRWLSRGDTLKLPERTVLIGWENNGNSLFCFYMYFIETATNSLLL